MTKTILTCISRNRTLDIVIYHYCLSNNNYTHTHTHARTHAQRTVEDCAHTNLGSSAQIQQLISDLNNNNTKLSLSSHPPTPCLLLLPGSLMLSPSPLTSLLSLSAYASIYIQQPHSDAFLQVLLESLGERECTHFKSYHTPLHTWNN